MGKVNCGPRGGASHIFHIHASPHPSWLYSQGYLFHKLCGRKAYYVQLTALKPVFLPKVLIYRPTGRPASWSGTEKGKCPFSFKNSTKLYATLSHRNQRTRIKKCMNEK